MHIVIALLSLSAACALGDIQYFNTDIFGEQSTSPVTVLKASPESAIAPFSVLLDVKAGVYYASTVNYPKSLSLNDVRGLDKAVEKIIKAYESE